MSQIAYFFNVPNKFTLTLYDDEKKGQAEFEKNRSNHQLDFYGNFHILIQSHD